MLQVFSSVVDGKEKKMDLNSAFDMSSPKKILLNFPPGQHMWPKKMEYPLTIKFGNAALS
jgi:hypothetical protein